MARRRIRQAPAPKVDQVQADRLALRARKAELLALVVNADGSPPPTPEDLERDYLERAARQST
jgi:hypothetical protein